MIAWHRTKLLLTLSGVIGLAYLGLATAKLIRFGAMQRHGQDPRLMLATAALEVFAGLAVLLVPYRRRSWLASLVTSLVLALASYLSGEETVCTCYANGTTFESLCFASLLFSLSCAGWYCCPRRGKQRESHRGSG